MNAPHEYHASAAVEGKVYAVGGTGPVTLEEYDPKSNRWKVLPGLPTPRDFLGVAALDKKIFTVGGITRARDAHATVEVFDAEKNNWTLQPDLAVPRNRLAVVAVAGKIYAIGGMANNQNYATVEVLDPHVNRWTRKADMPTPRHGHCAVALGLRILVIGGYNEAGPTAIVEEYDTKQDRWTRRASMPTPRGFFGAGAVGGKVYAIGGRVRGQPPVECYYPDSDTWLCLTPMPGGSRNRFGLAVLGEKIYILGGEFQGDRALPRSALCFDLSRDQTRFTDPPSTESEATRALIDKAKRALESGQSATSVLTDPSFLPAHEWSRFRKLIREFAPVGRATIITPIEPGERLTVTGKVVGKGGQRVSQAVMYFYQTSAKGWYSDRAAHYSGHEGDRKHARLFGYLKTDDTGGFELHTIRPAGYPNADLPAHIHVEIEGASKEKGSLITEIQFDDDPRLTPAWRSRSQQEGFVIARVTKDSQNRQKVDVELKAH
jgi:protocatechuate 3,4-dioxygenase beta subunit